MPRIADFRAFYRILGRSLFASVLSFISVFYVAYGEAGGNGGGTGGGIVVGEDGISHTVRYFCNFSTDNSYIHNRPTPRPVNYTTDNLTITGTCFSGQTCNVNVGLQSGPLSSQCSAPGRQFDHWVCMHAGGPINCEQTGISSNCTYGVTFTIPQNDNCSSSMAYVDCYVAWKQFKLTYNCGGGAGSAPSPDYEPWNVPSGQSGLNPLSLKSNSCTAPVNSNASFAGWYCSMPGISSAVTNVAGVYGAGSEFPIVGGNGKIWLNNATCTAVWKGPSQCEEGQITSNTLLDNAPNVNYTPNGTLPVSPNENELYVSFDYGNVYVQGMCSASTSTQGVAGTPLLTSGDNCWCRVWGYKGNNGSSIVPLTSTRWIGNPVSSGCANNCATECRAALQSNSTMRQKLYRTISCEDPATYTVSYFCGFGTGNAPLSQIANTANNYTVTLSNNSGTNCVAPDNSGASFAGWYCSMSNSTQDATVANVYGPNQSLNVTGNAICVAMWQSQIECDAETQQEFSSVLNGYGIDVGTSGEYSGSDDNVLFSYGNVYVQGMCSTSTSTQGVAGTPSLTSGDNCWCRVWKYENNSGITPLYNTQWVFHSSINTCEDTCSSTCRRALQSQSEMRQPLYTTIDCEDLPEEQTYTLNYNCGGGTGNPPASQNITVIPGGENYPISLQDNSSSGCLPPTGSGASFAGWYCSVPVNPDISGTYNIAGLYHPGDDLPMLNNGTCTAVWQSSVGCAEGQSQTQTLLNGLTGVEMSSNGTLPVSPYDNELYASFSYNNTPVNVYVQGMCSVTSAATQGATGNPSTEEGVNCWCRVWGYNNGTNFVPVYNTMWVYNNNNYASGKICYDSCPSACRRVLQREERMRDGLYATFGCDATEIVLKWLDFYGNNFNDNPQSCLFGTNGGITPIFNPGIIPGYDFAGWSIQSTSSGEQS